MNAAPIPFAGRATFQGGMLRIEGHARYPNEFSTATLKPLSGAVPGSPACQAYTWGASYEDIPVERGVW